MKILICDNCQKEISVKEWEATKYKTHFCSRKCHQEFSRGTKTCKQCGEQIKKQNIFCSRSCAAKYNNTHKKGGARRSKLELFIELKLKTTFPSLVILCNDKSVINSELDFYFPQLKLAIEINGIWHYEPIYGASKLERIQNNDVQKFRACSEKGIELCVINTSGHKYITENTSMPYFLIVEELVSSLLYRLEWG